MKEIKKEELVFMLSAHLPFRLRRRKSKLTVGLRKLAAGYAHLFTNL